MIEDGDKDGGDGDGDGRDGDGDGRDGDDDEDDKEESDKDENDMDENDMDKNDEDERCLIGRSVNQSVRKSTSRPSSPEFSLIAVRFVYKTRLLHSDF